MFISNLFMVSTWLTAVPVFWEWEGARPSAAAGILQGGP